MPAIAAQVFLFFFALMLPSMVVALDKHVAEDRFSEFVTATYGQDGMHYLVFNVSAFIRVDPDSAQGKAKSTPRLRVEYPIVVAIDRHSNVVWTKSFHQWDAPLTPAFDIALGADGELYMIGGWSGLWDGKSALFTVKLSAANGAVDPAFGAQGISLYETHGSRRLAWSRVLPPLRGTKTYYVSLVGHTSQSAQSNPLTVAAFDEHGRHTAAYKVPLSDSYDLRGGQLKHHSLTSDQRGRPFLTGHVLINVPDEDKPQAVAFAMTADQNARTFRSDLVLKIPRHYELHDDTLFMLSTDVDRLSVVNHARRHGDNFSMSLAGISPSESIVGFKSAFREAAVEQSFVRALPDGSWYAIKLFDAGFFQADVYPPSGEGKMTSALDLPTLAYDYSTCELRFVP